MKIHILFSVLLVPLIALTSFNWNRRMDVDISSSYSFTRDGDDKALIELKLDEDQNFVFLDNSNPSKRIEASGKYRVKGRHIYLEEIESNYPIAEKWVKDKDFDCISTRKGLAWTRICH